MPITIKMPSDNTEKDSWAIIELQGDLKSHTETEFENQFIGDLHFTKDGAPILIIGHNLLHGKEVSLDKPLALLEKSSSESGTCYIVKSIIDKKLLFKTRPIPIV